MKCVRITNKDGNLMDIVPAWVVNVYHKRSNKFITEVLLPSYEKAIEESLLIEQSDCDYRIEIHSPDGDVEDV